ncbi:SpvB/TcaC N-terminal domain-containing protein [Rhodococcus koreensis]
MNTSAVASDVITLPTGGGAIKGIGETFQPDLYSGTSNHSIPIATSPGRSGSGPALSLQYSSGNGNGPFGLGWQLSIPRITRKTEKGLPRYTDTDVFVMSGAEDLVPCLKKVVDPRTGNETWEPEDPVHRPLHTVNRYRPRTEGLFARIERWEHNATHEVHWRATTKENITSVYGGSPAGRIADPDNPQHVYEWLLQETFDATGNHIRYEYAKDNPQLYTHRDPGVDLPAIFDHNRNATQLYIRRIYYGNLPAPLLDSHGNTVTYPDGTVVGHERDGRRYAFEVLFDYGDWDTPTKEPHPDPAPDGQQELFGPDPSISVQNNPVPVREDRFSSFRAGFEIRTLRRCRRILMYHHFAELGGPTLVRSSDFTYADNAETRVSFLSAVTVTGYQKDAAGIYQSASMPPVMFRYAEFRPREQRYQSIVANGNDMPPHALNNPDTALVDLFGDGLPDVLHSGPAGFRYWRNLGGGRLDRPRVMSQIPAGIALSQPGVGFADMGGDGRADLMVHSGPIVGFFETTADSTWQTFKRYDAVPSFDLADPNVRLVDLTGDGLSDVLLSHDQYFLWFECLGEKGFAAPRRIARRHDIETFPDVFFDDPARRVRLADMTGDGLQDIVLVHNGRLDYWPNLGYGRFGKRVTMANAPRLERDFDPKHLFLADVNGNGCADLVYVASNRVSFWFNQSGNRWSGVQVISGTPRVSDIDSIQFADVFGTGTATLLWSYAFGAQRGANYKALDFCGGVKPYVLTEMSNNMGVTTRVSYAPSSRYFVEDQDNGTPWATKLPFPVQVVDKVEVIDHVSKTKLVTTYKYHHGYFDGREREFRGFGRVDQFDTETFEDFTESSLHGTIDQFYNNERSYHVPPVETRTWFHTGIYFDQDSPADVSSPFDNRDLTNRFHAEFYQGDEEAVALDEHHVETGKTPYQAFRALRGAVLRTEVYAHDGSAKADHPYQVTDHRYQVHQVQPENGNNHGVYFTSQMEGVTYHYERNPTDPRISHTLTLQVDAFGNALKSLAIGYGRRRPDPALPTPADRSKQTQTLITYTENRFTNGIDDSDNFRTPLPAAARTYELTGFTPADNAKYFSFTEWTANDFSALDEAVEIGYEETAKLTSKQRRLIEHVCTRYRSDDLTALLPFGAIESLALQGEDYKLAFTAEILTEIYGGRVTNTMLDRDGGYVHGEGDTNWWIPSGRIFYSPNVWDTPAQELAFAQQHFFLANRSHDPFNNTVFLGFDAYDLLVSHTSDHLGNTVRAEHDYRLVQPFRMTDPNGNRTEVAFDTLGLVAATAVMGKKTETKGDSLEGFVPHLTPQQRREFLTDPLGNAGDLLGPATTRIVYDLDQYLIAQQPIFAATLTRETHVSDPLPVGGLKIQVSFSYSDGLGREIQKKIQAEPGPLVEAGPVVTPRWVGSGWTIFNNKGKPVRQYDPFFSKHERGDGTFFSDHRFEFGVKIGVSPILLYDPLERVVTTLHANHTWEKILFDSWRQETWDVNDTVVIADPKTDADVGDFFSRLPTADYLPTWHAQRQGGAMGAQEQGAATKAAAHAGTPTLAYFDTLGRCFLTVAHNKVVCPGHDLDGSEAKLHTRIELDIEGNPRTVRDADQQAGDSLGRIVVRYAYDMVGNRIHQLGMDAGARWMLNDALGKPIRAWDSRGHVLTTTYDALRRPIGQTVRGTRPDSDPRTLDRDISIEAIQYGEPAPDATPAQEAEARRLNLRTRIYRHCDSAGVVTNARLDANGNPTEAYGFKGNLLHSTRQLVTDYTALPDWSLDPQPGLDDESFETTTRYDALNRPIQIVAPHSNLPHAKLSIIQPVFNEANLLERVDVWLQRGTEPAALLDPTTETPSPVGVSDIDYDAKGQRLRIDYKNGASTVYEYDRFTFRLRQLVTRRDATIFPGDDPQPPVAGWPGRQVQNLNYTYDPAGNITHIRDDAQQTIYFRNKRVEPSTDYIYDAVYRLIQATGREHLGQGSTPIAHSHNDDGRVGLLTADAAGRFAPNDGNAMGTYIERYVYDAVGNFVQMQHRGADPAHAGWTRTCQYTETSLIENGNGRTLLKTSDRLTRTTLNQDGASAWAGAYQYDVHGNIVRMPHLGGGAPGPNMHWGFDDRLRQVDLGGGGTAFYVYDSSGQRTRKIWEKSPGLTEERIYFGGFEILRTHAGPIDANTVTLERETLHVMDDNQRIAIVELRTVDIANNDQAPPRLIRYQFGNNLGSATLELDHQAQIITYEEYSPYGSTTYQGVRHQLETPKRNRYSGKERDEESGLSYHGARYYAPWLARWTSPDPLGIPDGTNVYLYASANPVGFSDPSGMSIEENVRNELKDNFKQRGIFYAEEVEFYVLDSSGKYKINPATGKPLVGRSDLVWMEPETGAIKFLEGKGTAKSDWTANQKDYIPDFEKGAEWEIKGTKGGNLGLSKGVRGSTKNGGFKLVHSGNIKGFIAETLGKFKIDPSKAFRFLSVSAKGERSVRFFSSAEELLRFQAARGAGTPGQVEPPPPRPAKVAPSGGTAPRVPGVVRAASVVGGAFHLLNLYVAYKEIEALRRGEDLTPEGTLGYGPGLTIINDFNKLPEGFSGAASSPVYGTGHYEKRNGDIYKDGILVNQSGT